MDDRRFDAIARGLARDVERRALLGRLPLRAPLAAVAVLDEAAPWERACREGWEGVGRATSAGSWAASDCFTSASFLPTDKLAADKIQAYNLQVKNGNRELVVGAKKSRNISRPIFVQVTRLADRLYQIEIDQTLENGEYCLSPDGENTTFAFQIY